MRRAIRERVTAVSLALVLGLVITGEWLALSHTRWMGILGDYFIYREAILFRRAGGSLYDYVATSSGVSGYGFTYPPFAALALVPLTLGTPETTAAVWMAVNLTFALGLVALVLNKAVGTPSTWIAGRSRVELAAVFFGAGALVLASFPFLHHFVAGQVSLLIVVLCLVDQSGLVPVRFQGILIGVAAAIKLTPLVFVVYFLLRRRWWTAARALGTFGGTGLLAFLVYPGDSYRYWGTVLFQTERVGEVASLRNRSLLGLLSRVTPDSRVAAVLWLALGSAVVIIGLRSATRLADQGLLIPAAILVGCLGTVVSPITWPHHQLWAVLAAVWLLVQRDSRSILVGVLVLFTFLCYPFFVDSDSPPGLAARLGAELPLVAVLAVCLIPRRRAPDSADVAPGSEPLTHAIADLARN